MLTAKILNSSATLNDFKYLQTIEFVIGSEVKFIFRLFDTQNNERYIPGSSAIVTLTFNKIDGTVLEKIATVLDSGDRSMLYVDITEAETEELLGGNVLIEVDLLGDATKIQKGVILSALSKILLDC